MTRSFQLMLAVAMALPAGLTGQAGPDAERLLVELAIARYAKENWAQRALGYEEVPREFGTPHEPTGPPVATYRSKEHSALLARLAGARLLESGRGALCEKKPAEDCVYKIFRIGVPDVKGDSATALAYVIERIAIPEGAAEMDYKMVIVRKQGVWTVVSAWFSREALFGPPPQPFKKPGHQQQPAKDSTDLHHDGHRSLVDIRGPSA